MAYQQKNNDISVFYQDQKRNERAPDWKGTALIGGVVYEVAFWTKSETMLAGVIKPKEARGIPD